MQKLYKASACPSCGNFTNRGLSVDAVVVRNGKVLLIKRAKEPFKGYWGTPGGYVGWDETIEEAVSRELKEETGLIVTTVKFVRYSSSPERHPKQVINFVYFVEADGDPIASDDALEFVWFDLNNLPENLAFDHAENIAMAIKLLK